MSVSNRTTSPTFRTENYEVRFWEERGQWYVVNRETGHHVGDFFTSQGAAERWMVRCQEDYEAGRRTIGERIPKVGHRPRGSGSTSVRLVEPSSQQSGRLYIGRALWQAIGEPARVDLLRAGGCLVIAAGDTFAVSGRQGSSIPRLSIGQATVESIGLEPGTYPATVNRPERSITVSNRTD